jgi:hypothetical protein
MTQELKPCRLDCKVGEDGKRYWYSSGADSYFDCDCDTRTPPALDGLAGELFAIVKCTKHEPQHGEG